MNGLFFGNTAAGGGVDPRYPKILIKDFIVVVYNACTYLNKSNMVSDNTYTWKKITDTFTEITNISIKLCMKTQWSFINTHFTTVDTCLYTVTNPDGFSTSKGLNLYTTDTSLQLNHTYNGVINMNVPELISSSQCLQAFKDIYETFNYQNCRCFLGNEKICRDAKTDSAFTLNLENQNIKIELKDNSFQGTEKGFIILVDNQPISIVIGYSITVE